MVITILKIIVCANALWDFQFNLNTIKVADKNAEDYIGYQILCAISVITTVATFIICWKG